MVREPIDGISSLAETIIFLRAVEWQARPHRLVAVRKVRNRAHDLAIRGFDVAAHGVVVDADVVRAEGILTSVSRRTSY